MLVNVCILVTFWVMYCTAHTILASDRIKKWTYKRISPLARSYRLIYNLFAVVSLIPPVWFTLIPDWPQLWSWYGTPRWIMDGIGLLASIGFVYSLSFYDGSEFIGIKQIVTRPPSTHNTETFVLSPLHNWVRHPWYLLALLIIWSRSMDVGLFISASIITMYFFIGSRFEDRKLVAQFGESYERYIQLVPGILPSPGRRLSKKDAQELIRQCHSDLHRYR